MHRASTGSSAHNSYSFLFAEYELVFAIWISPPESWTVFEELSGISNEASVVFVTEMRWSFEV